MNLLPLISVIKHKLALLGELSILQWQIELLVGWELENVLEAFIVKLISSLSPCTFTLPLVGEKAGDRMMRAVSWQSPQKRKSGLLAELLVFKPSGPMGNSWHMDDLRKLRGM